MGTDSMLPGVYVRVAGARCQISPWRSFVHALNCMWQDCSLTRLQRRIKLPGGVLALTGGRPSEDSVAADPGSWDQI